MSQKKKKNKNKKKNKKKKKGHTEFAIYVSIEYKGLYDETLRKRAPPVFPVLIPRNDELIMVSDCACPFSEKAPLAVLSRVIPSSKTLLSITTAFPLVESEITPCLFTA
jgi:hypothetical protein